MLLTQGIQVIGLGPRSGDYFCVRVFQPLDNMLIA